MRTKLGLAALVASACLLLSPRSCFAQVKSLDGCDLGDYWFGQQRTSDSLKGHVVFWVNFQDDQASKIAIGGVSKLVSKYGPTGFILIGNETDKSSRESVVALCLKFQVNYTFVGHGGLSGDNFKGGGPHAWLFDHEGKLVKEGGPAGLNKEIDETVAKAPHWITRGKALTTSEVKAVSEGLKQLKTFGWALGECEHLLQKDSEKIKEEATYLKTQILAEADTIMAEAKTCEAGDPARALLLYKNVSNGWGKAEQAQKADLRVRELGKDKAFQEELRLQGEADQITQLCAKLVVGPDGNYDLTSPKNANNAKQITDGAKLLKDKHPGSAVVKKLLDDLSAYGITPP